MTNWKFKTEIISFDFNKHGFFSHVQLPTAHEDFIYFSSRDSNGKSHINRISNDIFEVFLSPNNEFDKDGCMPSCFVDDVLVYSGWVLGGEHSYTHNICILEKNKSRLILTPEQDDSLLVNSAFVMSDKVYKMWYVSGYRWIGKKPAYVVNYAESKNLYDWTVIKKDCLPRLSKFESPSRPFVLKTHNNYEMYFASMDLEDELPSYKIQYAKSTDGISWTREVVDIEMHDQNMLCYPCIYRQNYMLVNGSNYGENSILLYEKGI